MAESETVVENARADELERVLELVRGAGLPTAGIADFFPGGYVVARSGSEVVGVAGLEVHGHVGLLRSVAVVPAKRGTGLGRLLVGDRVASAQNQKLASVYLLTTTAADYFLRLGFHAAPRAGAPLALQESSEFREVCPASAACLARALA